MNSKRIRLFLIIFLALIYNLVFWQQDLGLNVLLFSFSLMGSLLLLSPEARKVPNVWFSGLGSMFSGLMYVWNHSEISLVIHILSVLIFAGFVHRPQLKTVVHALQSITRSYLTVFINIYRRIRIGYYRGKLLKKLKAAFDVAWLPAAIIIPLLFIFAFTNPRFEYSIKVFLGGIWLLIATMSPERLIFLAFGLLLIGGMVSGCGMRAVLKKRKKFQPPIIKKVPSHAKNKQFYQTWVIIAWVVNALLLLFNISEIVWLWGGSQVEEIAQNRDLVFQALLLLIFVISASIITLAFVFKDPRRMEHIKGSLHNLAFLWIFQCIVVLASISIRVLHYIQFGGLSYNRLWVLLLIGFTFCCLLAMSIMLIHQKGTKFFFKLNYWMAYTLLIGVCAFNWDNILAGYNLDLSKKKYIAIQPLLELSDKTIPVLLKGSDVPEFPGPDHVHFYQGLNQKVANFYQDYPHRSWLAWNRADYLSYRYLDQKGPQKIGDYLDYQQKTVEWMKLQGR